LTKQITLSACTCDSDKRSPRLDKYALFNREKSAERCRLSGRLNAKPAFEGRQCINLENTLHPEVPNARKQKRPKGQEFAWLPSEQGLSGKDTYRYFMDLRDQTDERLDAVNTALRKAWIQKIRRMI
jgi:hypothetical protein